MLPIRPVAPAILARYVGTYVEQPLYWKSVQISGAPQASVELVGSEWVAPAETPEGGESEAPKQTKGVGERLRQVARRIRGDKGGGGSKAAHPSSQRRGSRQTSTPRKAGGS